MTTASGEESSTGGSRSEILSRISKMGQSMLPVNPQSSAAAGTDPQVSPSTVISNPLSAVQCCNSKSCVCNVGKLGVVCMGTRLVKQQL